MSINQSYFTHAPLDLAEQEIRLLEICAGPQLSSTYQIHHYPIDDYPPFKAVSYTWGRSDRPMTIEINGLPFQIRENLHSFLQQQAPHERRLYWIDAICIDQKNILERNHQVQLMNTIYAKAQEVLIWLGDADEDSNFAMKMMQERRVPQVWKAKFEIAFLQLLRRPYWRRVWVIQEILWARYIRIQCGNQKIDWSDFRHGFAILTRSIEPSDRLASLDVLGGNAHCRSIIRHKDHWGFGRKLSSDTRPLSHVLSLYETCEASDIRDKVYGFLGLVDPDATITVDYSNSVEELYFLVIWKVAETETYMSPDDLFKFCEMLKRSLEMHEGRDILMDELFKQSVPMWAWDQEHKFRQATLSGSKSTEHDRQHRDYRHLGRSRAARRQALKEEIRLQLKDTAHMG